MELTSTTVCLASEASYNRRSLKHRFAQMAQKLKIKMPSNCRVLLKPNLVSVRGHDGLACPHPEFIAALAELYLDYGCKVAIGDSPAFGTSRMVMKHCGISAALQHLPVRQIHFSAGSKVRLKNGSTVRVAPEIFDCNLLVNIPKVKAHNQLYLSLAAKNYFGCVTGWQKARLHMQHGADNSFVQLLTDLLEIMPEGVSFADGIAAMHVSGPITGSVFALNVTGAAVNPVALDTALIEVLGLRHEKSPLWLETSRRQTAGSRIDSLHFPMQRPAELHRPGFIPPAALFPIRFQPVRIITSGMKRICLHLLGKKKEKDFTG